jgi:hypothetical protein
MKNPVGRRLIILAMCQASAPSGAGSIRLTEPTEALEKREPNHLGGCHRAGSRTYPIWVMTTVQISQINYRSATIELYACMIAPKDSTENLLEGK